MNLTLEVEQEEDGQWISEVIGLPGVLAYGRTCEEGIMRTQALALRVLADRLEHGESSSTNDKNHAMAIALPAMIFQLSPNNFQTLR
jgi:predicted RNase H-like HicB family nuclease